MKIDMVCRFDAKGDVLPDGCRVDVMGRVPIEGS